MATDPLQKAAPGITQDAKDTARNIANDTKQTAASGLGEFAGALRKVAREVGDGKQVPVSRMMQSAADGLERFSGSLQNKDLNGLLGDVESFARRQPVAFFGAAIAVGFLATRFLKSSNTTSDQTLPY
jgi:hypothetical protein